MTSSKIFYPLDEFSIGAFRVALGICIILTQLFYKLPYLEMFFSNQGAVSIKTISIINPSYSCSLLKFITTDIGLYVFFGLTVLTFLFYTLGIWSKFFGVIGFIFLNSFYERNFTIVTGADIIFSVLLFWSLFLSLDNHLSISKRFKTKIKGGILGSFGILFQIGVIYFFNFFSKSGENWRDGTAIAFGMMQSSYKGILTGWVLQYPLLYSIANYLTLVIEISIPLLIFSPYKYQKCRLIASCLIFLLHYSIIPFLNVGYFFLAVTPISVLLLPKLFWNKLNINIEKNNSNYAQANSFFSRIKLIVFYLAVGLVFIINLSYSNTKLTWIVNHMKRNWCNCFGLNQQWKMFEKPRQESGYTMIIGLKDNEERIDLSINMPIQQIQVSNSRYDNAGFPIRVFDDYVRILAYESQKNNAGEIIYPASLLREDWCKYIYKEWLQKNSKEKIIKISLVKVSLFPIDPGNIYRLN